MKIIREFTIEEYVIERLVENGFKTKRERKTFLVYYLEEAKKQLVLWNEDHNTVEIKFYKRSIDTQEIKWQEML